MFWDLERSLVYGLESFTGLDFSTLKIYYCNKKHFANAILNNYFMKNGNYIC